MRTYLEVIFSLLQIIILTHWNQFIIIAGKQQINFSFYYIMGEVMSESYVLSQREDYVCYLLEKITNTLTRLLHNNVNNIQLLDEVFREDPDDHNYINRCIRIINHQIKRYNEGTIEIKIKAVNYLYKLMYP